MPDHPLTTPSPVVLFPLKLEINHEPKDKVAQVCWYPDSCQVNKKGDTLDVFISQGYDYPALPDKVLLYSMDSSGKLEWLAESVPLDKEKIKLSIPNQAEEFNKSKWLWDFSTAEQTGMGITLKGDAYKKLLDAQWLIVMGYKEDHTDALLQLITSHENNKNLRILKQNEPTNHTEEEKVNPIGSSGDSDTTVDLPSDSKTNAQLLSEVFPGSSDLWKSVSNTESIEHDIIAHVHRVTWDLCIHQIVDPGSLSKERYQQLKKFYVNSLRGRGYFPGIRIKDDPYGILPTMASPKGVEGIFPELYKSIDVTTLKNLFLQAAWSHSRRIKTNESSPGQLNILQEILKQKAVSDINDLSQEQNEVDVSLFQRLMPIAQAVVPAEEQSSFLASMNLLSTLYKDRAIELDGMILEALNCFMYRFDAWLSAEAIDQFNHHKDQTRGVGVYGWLENPLKSEVKRKTPEYHQAPSLNQARTLAILRAGSLTTEKAYQVNLNSSRVSQAVSFLSELSTRIPINEILGNRVERFFHDQNADSIIHEIVDLISYYKGNNPLNKMIDGLTFVLCDFENHTTASEKLDKVSKSIKDKLNDSQYGVLLKAWNEVKNFMDAVSDVSIAEVIYKYNLGNIASVRGWLEFINGKGIPPSLPDVIKTPIDHHTQQQRVILLMEHVEHKDVDSLPGNSTVRQSIDPSIANFCNQYLHSPNSIRIEISWMDQKSVDQKVIKKTITVSDAFHWSAIDIVLGNKQELERRIRLWVLMDILEHRSEYDQLAQDNFVFKTLSETEMLNQLYIKYVDFEREKNNDWKLLFKKAEALSSLLHKNESLLKYNHFQLEYRAEDKSEDLSKNDLVESIKVTVKQIHLLKQRIKLIDSNLSKLHQDVSNMETESIVSEEDQLDVKIAYLKLADKLIISGIKDTGDLTALFDFSKGNEGFKKQLKDIRDKLTAVRDNLNSFDKDTIAEMIQDTPGECSSLEDYSLLMQLSQETLSKCALTVKDLLRQLTEALVSSGGEESHLKILIPIPWIIHNSWFQESNNDTELHQLSMLRPSIKELNEIKKNSDLTCRSIYSTYKNWKRIEQDLQIDLLKREVPMADIMKRAFVPQKPIPSGNTDLHIYCSDTVFSKDCQPDKWVVGLRVDEWTDCINHTQQTSAVTFNFDVPDAEAPNAILLCVPSGTGWQQDEVAGAIANSINTMCIRTLSKEDVKQNPQLKHKFFDTRFPNSYIKSDGSIHHGLKATVNDPAWFLARQWQLGEFLASNGGSVSKVEIEFTSTKLDKIRLKNWMKKIQIPELPLEAVVESGNKKDGFISAEKKESKPLGWKPRQLAYNIVLQGGKGFNKIKLNANDYTGEHLDWYNFQVKKDNLRGKTIKTVKFPQKVRFRGLPHERWWAFENSNVDFTSIDIPDANILTMLLIEFGVLYSNDWFLIPLNQEVGTVRKIRKLVVYDSFGKAYTIPPHISASTDPSSFGMFTLNKKKKRNKKVNANLLFVPNTMISHTYREPLEEVIFKRDDFSNSVWAIEKKRYKLKYEGNEVNIAVNTVADTDQKNKDDTGQKIEKAEEEYYKLLNNPPAHWIPYIPQQLDRLWITRVFKWILVKIFNIDRNQVYKESGQIFYRRGRTCSEVDDRFNLIKQYKTRIVADSKLIAEHRIPSIPISIAEYIEMTAYGEEKWSTNPINDTTYEVSRELPHKKRFFWIGRLKKAAINTESVTLQYDDIVSERI